MNGLLDRLEGRHGVDLGVRDVMLDRGMLVIDDVCAPAARLGARLGKALGCAHAKIWNFTVRRGDRSKNEILVEFDVSLPGIGVGDGRVSCTVSDDGAKAEAAVEPGGWDPADNVAVAKTIEGVVAAGFKRSWSFLGCALPCE